jgi:hypothetical protein
MCEHLRTRVIGSEARKAHEQSEDVEGHCPDLAQVSLRSWTLVKIVEIDCRRGESHIQLSDDGRVMSDEGGATGLGGSSCTGTLFTFRVPNWA